MGAQKANPPYGRIQVSLCFLSFKLFHLKYDILTFLIIMVSTFHTNIIFSE